MLKIALTTSATFIPAGNAELFCSNRLAIKIPTAGAIGRMERTLTVQLKKAANANIPNTQSANSDELTSRFCQTSATAKAATTWLPNG